MCSNVHYSYCSQYKIIQVKMLCIISTYKFILYQKQVAILISKNQALQILYLNTVNIMKQHKLLAVMDKKPKKSTKICA